MHNKERVWCGEEDITAYISFVVSQRSKKREFCIKLHAGKHKVIKKYGFDEYK